MHTVEFVERQSLCSGRKEETIFCFFCPFCPALSCEVWIYFYWMLGQLEHVACQSTAAAGAALLIICQYNLADDICHVSDLYEQNVNE